LRPATSTTIAKDLAVGDLGRVEGAHEFERGGALTARFGVRVFLANALAFKRRAVRDRDRQLGDLDLQTADLDCFLHEFVAADVGDDVLVRAHARREDLGDVARRNRRESVADRASGGGVPFICDLAER
jgi:hypothetical protein